MQMVQTCKQMSILSSGVIILKYSYAPALESFEGNVFLDILNIGKSEKERKNAMIMDIKIFNQETESGDIPCIYIASCNKKFSSITVNILGIFTCLELKPRLCFLSLLQATIIWFVITWELYTSTSVLWRTPVHWWPFPAPATRPSLMDTVWIVLTLFFFPVQRLVNALP